MALFTNKQLLVGGAIVTGLVFMAKKKAKKVISEDLNPVSDKNIAYTAVNKMGSVLAEDENFTLGGWIYDKTHDSPFDEIKHLAPGGGFGGGMRP